jgi:hypothetical protein
MKRFRGHTPARILRRELPAPAFDGLASFEDYTRYESLHDDFATVCRHLGVKAERPHVNGSHRRDYRGDYDDGRLVDLVARVFSDDIERFGYTFDGAKSDPFADRARAHYRAI